MQLKAPLRLVSRTGSQSSGFHPHEQAVAGDAGVVDEDVDPLEPIEDLLDRRLHRGPIRDVDLERDGIDTERLHLLSRLGGLLEVDVRHHDVGAALRQPSDDRLAYTLPASGDDRYLALEIHTASSPRRLHRRWGSVSESTRGLSGFPSASRYRCDRRTMPVEMPSSTVRGP